MIASLTAAAIDVSPQLLKPKPKDSITRKAPDTKPPDLFADINVTAPALGAKWRLGSEKAILWTADPAKVGPNVRVLLMKAQQVQTASGQQAQYVIKDSWSSGGSGYNWKIPMNVTPGDYKIVVQSTTNGKSGSSQTFKLVPQPTFAFIQPAANATWQAGKSYTVQWTYSGEAAGPLTLLLFCTGGNTVENIPLNGPSGNRTYLFPVSSQAGAGPAVLLLIEKNKDAALENDLIGYRGIQLALKIVK
jgi:hypothetical protein